MDIRSGQEWDLQRFLDAQDTGSTWDRAVTEIRQGEKVTHWMWFVFPQLAALGRSSTAKFYGLAGLDEARAYQAHLVLGRRLIRSASAVLEVERDPETIFGTVDAMKLRSCVTLFSIAAPEIPTYREVIDQLYDGTPDASTLHLLSPGS